MKTPLTSMSLMTDLLEEYQTQETLEYYNRLTSQITRLQNLVSGLLALAKLDSHGIVLEKKQFRIQDLIDILCGNGKANVHAKTNPTFDFQRIGTRYLDLR